jgi:hypothetical protein
MKIIRKVFQQAGWAILASTPTALYLWLANIYEWDDTWILTILIILGIFWFMEVDANKWSHSDQSWNSLKIRDKTTYSIALTLLLIFTIWPLQQGFNSLILLFAFWLLGMIVFIGSLWLFGTTQLRSYLSK